MVGADIHIVRPTANSGSGLPRLTLDRLNLPQEGHFGVALRDISLGRPVAELEEVVTARARNELTVTE